MPPFSLGRSFSTLMASMVFVLASQAAEPADQARFVRDVQPILAKHCLECHSPSAAKPKGGLDLTSREHLLRGGASGPALLPGQAKQSLILQIVQRDGTPHMPPNRQLTDGEIAVLA